MAHKAFVVKTIDLLASSNDTRVPAVIDLASPSTNVIFFAGEDPSLSFAGSDECNSSHIQFCKRLKSKFRGCKSTDDIIELMK